MYTHMPKHVLTYNTYHIDMCMCMIDTVLKWCGKILRYVSTTSSALRAWPGQSLAVPG